MKIKNKNFQIQRSFSVLKMQTQIMIRFFLISILFFIGQITHCQFNQELFLQGNNYFLKGNFNKALDCYEQISEKNSAVWHNMGNCFFNEKNNVKAIICWKRAERNASFYELGKLIDSQSKAFQKLDLSSDSFLQKKVKQFSMIVSASVLKIILIIFLLLFLYACCYHFLQLKRFGCKKQYMIWLLIAIVTFLFAINQKEKFLYKKEGVVIHEKIPVYVGPEITFTQKALLPLGSLVQVLEEKQGMIKVIYSQGSGWISSYNIEIV